MVKERGCHENHTPIRIIKIPLVLLKSHLFSDHAFCKFFDVGGKLSINILSNSNCICDEKSLLVPTGQCSNRFEPRTEISFFFFLLSIGRNGEKEGRIKKRGAGRKDRYRKTTGRGKLCCILLSFNFRLPLWNKTCFFQISFSFCRSASVFRSASVNFSLQISFSFCRIVGSIMLKNEKFQIQQMKLKRWDYPRRE